MMKKESLSLPLLFFGTLMCFFFFLGPGSPFLLVYLPGFFFFSQVPRRMGITQQIESPFPDITVNSIVERVIANRKRSRSLCLFSVLLLLKLDEPTLSLSPACVRLCVCVLLPCFFCVHVTCVCIISACEFVSCLCARSFEERNARKVVKDAKGMAHAKAEGVKVKEY